MHKKRFFGFVHEHENSSFLESLRLPKFSVRCKVDPDLVCVDPESDFCEAYPFPVDPVDPDRPDFHFHDYLTRFRSYGSGSYGWFGQHTRVFVFEREHVFVPACAYYLRFIQEK